MRELLGFLETQGGVLDESEPLPGPAHFGDGQGELEALVSDLALYVPGTIGVLRLDGEDAQRFCNSMLTNNFRDMAPGDSNHSAITDNKGRIEAFVDGHMIAPGRFILVFDGADMEWAHDRLDMYIIMDPIDLTLLHETHTLLHLSGPSAAEELANLGMYPEGQATEFEGGVVLPSDRTGRPGWDLLVRHDLAQEIWSQLRDSGATPIGTWAAEAGRIRAGIPRFPQDIGKRAFPHEMGLRDRICSFTKGCYMGQEVINRMDTMGRLNKRLVQIALQEPLSTPTEAMADDAPIGTLTSFTRVGPPIALGILRPVVWEEGSTLQVDSRDASSLGPVRLS